MRATMAARWGPILGRSQISVTSTWAMLPPAAATSRGGMAEEAMRRRAAPLRIAGREMQADIAGAERAQDRVGERVEPDIGIGMADQAALMRELDAAEPDAVAGAEGVDVEALAGADVARLRREPALGLVQILGRRHLEIRLAAGDEAHGEAGALGDRGVVGEGRCPRRRDARRGSADSESPAASAPARAAARSRVSTMRPSAPRFTVSLSGSAGMAPGASSSAASTRSMVARSRKGRAPSWISTRSGVGLGEALEAEPHRILPRRAARHRRQQVEAARGGVIRGAASSGLKTTRTASMRGMARQRRRGCSAAPAGPRAADIAWAAARPAGCRAPPPPPARCRKPWPGS